MPSRLFRAACQILPAALIFQFACLSASAQVRADGDLFPGAHGQRPKDPPRPVTPVQKDPVPATPGVGGATDPEPVMDAAPVKTAPPSAEQLASADKLIDDVFGADISASKTPALKSALAKKLIDASAEEKSPVTRYAVLSRAKTLAADAGDIETVLVAIEKMGDAFEFDALKAGQELLVAASKTLTTGAQKLAGYSAARRWGQVAIAAERFDIAHVMCDLCLGFARGCNDPIALKEATLLILTVRETEQAAADLKNAYTVLSVTPDSPASNLTVGLYRCYYKGNWITGLQNLAKGSDKTMAELAKLEISAPQSADDLLKIADGWWDVAQPLSAVTRPRVLEHAGSFYHAALPKLEGLAKVRAEKRLQETGFHADAAPAGDGFVPAFLAKIPAELLPVKGDTPTESLNKSNGFQRWLVNNRPVGNTGADLAATAKFFGMTTLPMAHPPAGELTDAPRPQRYLLKFEYQTETRGTPVNVMISVYLNTSGNEDPAFKEASAIDKAGAGVRYRITAKINSMSTVVGRVTRTNLIPALTLNLMATSGEYSAKPAQ